MVIMPDAEKDDAIDAMAGAIFDGSGATCIPLSVTVMVGEAQEWIPDFVEKAKGLTVGPGH